jgi:hypothetical protein
MTVSSRLTPRAVLVWGLVVIALLSAAATGVALVQRVRGAVDRASAPATPRLTHGVVVERLQAVAKLVSTEMTLRDVVTYEQTRFAATKRALVVVTGRVSAGIDLERNTNVEIDSVAKRIVFTLPPAEILGIDIVDVRTYSWTSGRTTSAPGCSTRSGRPTATRSTAACAPSSSTPPGGPGSSRTPT